jgi:hypothetical protein
MVVTPRYVSADFPFVSDVQDASPASTRVLLQLVVCYACGPHPTPPAQLPPSNVKTLATINFFPLIASAAQFPPHCVSRRRRTRHSVGVVVENGFNELPRLATTSRHFHQLVSYADKHSSPSLARVASFKSCIQRLNQTKHTTIERRSFVAAKSWSATPNKTKTNNTLPNKKTPFNNNDEQGYIPHYALPNTAHVLPRYANTEQDNVKMSFQIGNFRSLKLLPNDVRPDAVNALDANHAAANIRSAPASVYGTWKKIDPHGLFHSFEYRPDPYHDILGEAEKESKMTRETQAKAAHPRAFRAGTTATHDETRVIARNPEQEQEDALVNFDPYSDIDDHKRRQRWLQRQKILHGPFKTGSRTKMTSVVNRNALPDILKKLTRQLDVDWEDADFCRRCEHCSCDVLFFVLLLCRYLGGATTLVTFICVPFCGAN